MPQKHHFRNFLSLEASLRGSIYSVHIVQELLVWQVVTLTQQKPTSESRTRMNRIQKEPAWQSVVQL